MDTQAQTQPAAVAEVSDKTDIIVNNERYDFDNGKREKTAPKGYNLSPRMLTALMIAYGNLLKRCTKAVRS